MCRIFSQKLNLFSHDHLNGPIYHHKFHRLDSRISNMKNVAFCVIIVISRQKKARRRDHVLLLSNDFNGLFGRKSNVISADILIVKTRVWEMRAEAQSELLLSLSLQTAAFWWPPGWNRNGCAKPTHSICTFMTLLDPTHQTLDVDPMLFHCWASVADDGTA